MVGSVNIDLVVAAEHIPCLRETVLGSTFQTFSGGKGANQAVAAARLGAPVSMVAKLGDDAFSDGLRRNLTQAGVDTSRIGKTSGPSGVAVIATDHKGENAIIVVPGANATLSLADLDENPDLLRSAGVLLCQLEVPLKTVEHLAVIAEKNGIPLVLDPAPACSLPGGLLHRVEWITPNETEAARLFGLAEHELTLAAFPQIASRLLALGPHNVIIKAGKRGYYLASQEHHEFVSAFQVQALDTTAAGDAYNGAFAVGLMEGRNSRSSADFASAPLRFL